MKKRLQNWITSIMGIILFLFALVAFLLDKIEWIPLVCIAFAGAFLVYAKDGVLKKITFGILKINDK